MITENKTTDKNIILAIETAVAGGSLAVLENRTVIDGWVGGSATASGSEIVFGEIKRLLEKNSIEKKRIKLIAVSNGPGSFTGARIGASIAKGLGKSLGCAAAGFTVLEAMALTADFSVAGSESETKAKPKNENSEKISVKKICAAIPFPRETVCFQSFTVSAGGNILSIEAPRSQSSADFYSQTEAAKSEYDELILHDVIYREILNAVKNDFCDFTKLINAGLNLAALIGKCAVDLPVQKSRRVENAIEPLYVRNF